jgi:hypothetical protein
MEVLELYGCSIWRGFALRSCGLPFTWTDRLRSTATTELADTIKGSAPEGILALRGAIEADRAALWRVTVEEFFADPTFVSAVLWQNRTAWSTGLSRLRSPESDLPRFNSKYRQYERLLVKYVQRYCAKNDTIGFFGPLLWGVVSEGASCVQLEPASQPATLEVFFERWALQAIIDAAFQSPAVRLNLRPLAKPIASIPGAITLPNPKFGKLCELLLDACDGVSTFGQIAARPEISREAARLGLARQHLYVILSRLEQEGALGWTPELPFSNRRTQTAYTRHILTLACSGDNAAGAKDLLERFDGLCEVAASLRQVAFDPLALDERLAALELKFNELTGSAATRRPGQTYAARTPVYLDCVRGGTIRIPDAFIRGVGLQLAAISRSLRWLTYRMSGELESLLYEALIGDELRQTGTMPLARAWRTIAAMLPNAGGHHPPEIVALLQEFATRWASVLEPAINGQALSPEQMLSRVDQHFDAPHVGWPSAVFYAPDLMILGRSSAEIDSGAALVILGEIHLKNTLEPDLFFDVCPDKPGMLRRAMAEVGVPRFVNTLSARHEHSRSVPHLHPDCQDVYFDINGTGSSELTVPVVRLDELSLEFDGTRLTIAQRSTGHRWDLVHFLDTRLGGPVFDFLPSCRHRPRITVGSMVLFRESWTFSTEELDFLAPQDEATRFLLWRRFAVRNRLPRRMFAKITGERKPFMVDAESVPLTQVLMTEIRKSSELHLTEMLPVPMAPFWSSGTDGEPYACELRMVVTDHWRWVQSATTSKRPA